MAITYRGEKFAGYNKPKNARTKSKSLQFWLSQVIKLS